MMPDAHFLICGISAIAWIASMRCVLRYYLYCYCYIVMPQCYKCYVVLLVGQVQLVLHSGEFQMPISWTLGGGVLF